jgi:hypothetical protein
MLAALHVTGWMDREYMIYSFFYATRGDEQSPPGGVKLIGARNRVLGRIHDIF